jgi:hypothetical protein
MLINYSRQDKKFEEELRTRLISFHYKLSIDFDTGRIENTASSLTSIAVYVFIASGT